MLGKVHIAVKGLLVEITDVEGDSGKHSAIKARASVSDSIFLDNI